MSLSKSLSMPSWSKERGDSVTSLSSGQNRLPENLMNGQMLLERTCFRRTSSTTNFSPAPCIGKIWREKGAACPSEHHFHMSCCQCFSVSAFTFLFFRANDFGEEHVAYVAGTTFFFSRLRLTIRVPRFPCKVPSLRACVY